MEDAYKSERSARIWRTVSVLLMLVVLGLAIALIVVLVQDNRGTKEENIVGEQDSKESKPITRCNVTNEEIDLSEAKDPGVFRDLTPEELRSVLAYLTTVDNLKLVLGYTKVVAKSSYINHIELIQPKKKDVLEYLDNNGKKPDRWAKAVIFRGDSSPPQVEEYKVGPLPQPNTHSLIGKPIDYAYRPLVWTEYVSLGAFFERMDKEMGVLLQESYGATFTNCGERCLSYSFAGVSTHAFSAPTRHFWLTVYFKLDYQTLYPVDLVILLNVDSVDPEGFKVIEIRYFQQSFATMADLMDSYNNTLGFKKTKIRFPSTPNDTMYSSMKIRGTELPKSSLRPPSTHEPDGKRYTIKDNHLTYMGWAFDLRMVSSRGPALYDIRFLEERIAYELSFQEIAVFYAANSPAYRMADYLDSVLGIGTLSRALVPGYDCPKHATFIAADHVLAGSSEPVRYDKALCVFEIDTGVPLHRHHSYMRDDGAFYGGMPDIILTVRTIIVVANYDYIFDFIFHQSGALEVKAYSTGYIITGYPSAAEKPYGWTLRQQNFGPLHHHIFNFKVDLDIHGTSNRFEKLNILPTVVKNAWSANPNDNYNQIKFNRTLVTTEDEARYNYDFTKPTYLIFHNNDKTIGPSGGQNRDGLPKSYRLHPTGIAKSLVPPNENAEVSISWARQQVAVTTHKDEEEGSSSIYSFWDSHNPTVNFDSFINGEDIVDQDLVAWVSLGTHHIPHTEDFPVTPTAGAALSFSLTPYNYFPMCPSFRSRDGLYMALDDKGKVQVQEEGGETKQEEQCTVKQDDFIKLVQNDPSQMFV